MKLNHYQHEAHKLANPDAQIAIMCLGLAGEAGEVCDYLKKVLGHGHDLNLQTLCSELGDILWYLAEIATLHDLTLEAIAIENLKKVNRRYPKGFSSQASVNRVV